jgi:hypothetical protein
MPRHRDVAYGVASDDNELRLARSQLLQGRSIAEGDCKVPSLADAEMLRQIANDLPLPDFITSASLALMLLDASFLDFFGGMLTA